MSANPATPDEVLSGLFVSLGLAPPDASEIRLMGQEPVAASAFRIGTAAQTSIAAGALLARRIGARRGIHEPPVTVDVAHALTECRSERYLRIDGETAPDPWDAIAGVYRCKDGHYVRVHTNFPHHRAGLVQLLGCDDDKASVAGALVLRDAAEIEAAATQSGLIVAMVRDFAGWDASTPASAIARSPLVSLKRIGDAPRQPLRDAGRALESIRVAEFTRIIAGPVAGRSLAAHGADVLRMIAPAIPTIATADIDTGRGKRSAFLDIADSQDRDRLHGLLATADVLLSSYRPGVMEEMGLGADALAASHPGLIVASLSAYGRTGPWGGRRGFDSIVQAATGFNLKEAGWAESDLPRPLPAQILDHAAGHLLAFGIMSAILRRADQGGSWAVEVSLARTGLWLRSLGQSDARPDTPDLAHARASSCEEASTGHFGQVTAIRPAWRASGIPPLSAPEPFGASAPHWLDRLHSN